MTAPVAPMEARHSVTPLEALKRLIAVAKWPDAMAFASEVDWITFQRELGVAEMVVRDYVAPVAPQPALPKLPSTPEEVVAFIDGQFDSMDTVGNVEDRRISLTVHDLLSCFQNLADFAGEQPAQQVEAEPVGWLVYAESNNGMVPQFPVYETKTDALIAASRFGQTLTGVSAVYAAPQLEAHKDKK